MFQRYNQFQIFFIFVVNKLKQETEVMINIPDSDKTPSSNVIRIEGNKEGVRKAKEVSTGSATASA